MDPVLCTASKAQKTLNVVLVDHNELSGRWYRKYPDLKSRVCSIIDHHEDAGHFLDAVPRIVKVCGSTASLIVEMAKNGEMTERLEQLARLLLQTIIFDTVNLTWRHKPIDVEAVQTLSSSFLKVKQEGTKVMHELEEAVALVPEDGFDIYDLLHKDYKLYVHYPKNSVIYYGISTLHIPFSVMLGSDNKNLDKWMESVQRFMADEDIQLLLMTNAVRERGSAAHSQQFAIFSNPKHSALVTKLYELLQSKDVGLELIISGANFALYNQHNITISRKQFHPITRAFMATQFPQ
jgi:inorganic pyrophosphatase/exopolyphosphatase